MWFRGCLSFLLVGGAISAPALLNVNVVFRHGDRTPITTVRTDPYQEGFWGVPWGTLTTTGMEQQYANGLRLKKRYIDDHKLVNATYSPYEIYVQSAQIDRCLQSAASNLAGFYDQSTFHPTDPKWPNNYTPIPIHQNPSPDRWYEPGSGCQKASDLEVERTINLNLIEYEGTHWEMIFAFAKNTGLDITHIKDTFDYFDTIVCEKDHNLTLPAWITPSLYREAEDVKSQTMDYFFGLGGFGVPDNEDLLGLRGGPALSLIQSTWTEKAPFKYYVHSAHDTTIVAILYTLGTNAKYVALGKNQPNYAATLLFETWKMDDGSLAIKVLYSDSAYEDFHVITNSISGCPFDDYCPVDKFISRNKPYIWDDMEKACKA
ncbi:unnamed protein product, partial [Mesorhabditis spiculigera]